MGCDSEGVERRGVRNTLSQSSSSIIPQSIFNHSSLHTLNLFPFFNVAWQHQGQDEHEHDQQPFVPTGTNGPCPSATW